MSTKEEISSAIGVGELLNVEKAVLRTLCLTVNTAGSELKYKILDTLSSDDFYFPVNKAIFEALEDMHRKGDYIIYTNLDEELRRRSVHFPEDFFLEDLFNGELPRPSDLGQNLTRIKERSAKGLSPRPDDSFDDRDSDEGDERSPEASRKTSSAPDSDPALTQVRLSPAPASKGVERGSSDRETSKSSPNVKVKSSPNIAVKSSPEILAKNAPTIGGKSSPIVLASEGTELSSYLEELGAKQGKSFESGFPSLDALTEGLSPGLTVIADDDRDRLSAFLKQLTDQIAERAKVACLFISYRNSKASLRVRTLSRLSGVAARDIEKGRLKKDSSEWKKVEQCGMHASSWMKRLFVMEASDDTNLNLVRKMCRQLMDSSNGTTCALVVDGMERLGKDGKSLGSVAGDLKELAESLDVVVVGATNGAKPIADPATDVAIAIKDGKSGVVLEVLLAGESTPQRLSFEYLPSIYRFIDKA